MTGLDASSPVSYNGGMTNTITARCGTCKGPAKTYRKVTVCSSLRCRTVTPK